MVSMMAVACGAVVSAVIFAPLVWAASDAECTFTLAMLAQGLEPPPGACFGPNHRVQRRRAALQSGNCGVDRVTFVADANRDAAASCGDCSPGHSFIEDGACSLGAYCRDNGTCADVGSSPFFGSACPFELGAHSSIGWCGSGLRCYAGRCVECLAGIDHIPEALGCSAAGRWSLLPAESATPGPVPGDATTDSLLLASLLVSGVTSVLVSVLCCQQCCCSRTPRSPPVMASAAPHTPIAIPPVQTPRSAGFRREPLHHDQHHQHGGPQQHQSQHPLRPRHPYNGDMPASPSRR